MPYPSKTNADEIISAAIDLIQNDGEEALTVARRAAELVSKAPSLYKHFTGRDAIIEQVEQRLFEMLGQVLRDSIHGNTASSLFSACLAHREFAKKHSRLYPILFSRSRLEDDAAIKIRAQSAGAIVGLFEDDARALALKKARTITAYVHGFVTIEIAEGFQLDGDIDEAFEYGAKKIIQAILTD